MCRVLARRDSFNRLWQQLRRRAPAVRKPMTGRPTPVELKRSLKIHRSCPAASRKPTNRNYGPASRDSLCHRPRQKRLRRTLLARTALTGGGRAQWG